MHSNQETVEQVNRKYQPGDIVRHKKYLGIFRVLGYTNRLPDSNVFVQSFNSPETYDLNEGDLFLVDKAPAK